MVFMALCTLQSVARTHNIIYIRNNYIWHVWYTTKVDLQCECVSAYFITFDLRLFLCAPLYVHLIYAYMAVIIIRPYCRGLRTNDFKITFTIVSDDCEAKEGTPCQNGACLDSLCHCNDGYGGCSCQVPGMHVHIYHYHYTITMRIIYGIIIFSARPTGRLGKCVLRTSLETVFGGHVLLPIMRRPSSDNNNVIKYIVLYCLQTRTNASTGRATCSPTAPTRWAASRVPVFQDTSATGFTAKVWAYIITLLENRLSSPRNNIIR